MVDQADQGQEDGLAGRCLDDGRLAHAGCIQVDVGTLLGSVFVDIEIEDFDNVADKVWELTGIVSAELRAKSGSHGERGGAPVVVDLVNIVLDLLQHGLLLVCQALEL